MAGPSQTQKTNYISDVRSAVTQLANASALCRSLLERGTDMGMFTGAGKLVDADFINENSGLTYADFVAGGTAATNALVTADRQAIAKIRL